MKRRVDPGPRGRRAVLATAAVFAMTQMVLAVAEETVRPDLRDPSFGTRLIRLRQRVRERPGAPLVVAVGSSRVELGFRPDALGPSPDGPIVFNFGQPAAGPVREWLVLRRLWDDGIRPARVLVEVMPPALAAGGPIDGALSASRLGWGDVADLAPESDHPWIMCGEWLAARLVPVCSGRFCLVSRVAPLMLPVADRLDYVWNGLDADGACELPAAVATPEGRRHGLAVAAAEYRDRLSEFTIAPVPDRFLRRILDDCRRQDAPAALLLMPEGEAFRQWYPPGAGERLDAYVRGLADEFGVPVIDARRWMRDEDFWDGHHLLPGGAAAFSRRLALEAKAFLGTEPADR
ncbi:MAG TPA: hypothetical protein VGF55_04230 [Gemmataceae bacterium]|jgi:hypothetical protein